MTTNNSHKHFHRFYEHLAQYIPNYATVRNTSSSSRNSSQCKRGQLLSLNHKVVEPPVPINLDSIVLTPRSQSNLHTKEHPVVVQPLPYQPKREKYHFSINIKLKYSDSSSENLIPLSAKGLNIPDATSFDRMSSLSRSSSALNSARSINSSFTSAEVSPINTSRDFDEPINPIIDIDKPDLPEIPLLATDLIQFLATIPDSAPASLSPYTFCEEVVGLQGQEFEQYLEEDTLCLKSVLLGNRFNEDTLYDFFVSLTEDQYQSAFDIIFRQYFKLANIANLLRDLMKVDSIPDLAREIEKQCEILFGARTAMVWINIPSAKTLINHSRLMKYPHGVGFVGTAATEKRQVVAPNPTTSPLYSEEFDLPFCEESEMILAEPIFDPKTNEVYAVIMLIDKVHPKLGASYMYWPQSELTLLHFFSSNLYRAFGRFTTEIKATAKLYRVIAKFVSNQLDFFHLLSTVRNSISQLLKCEAVSIYFREGRGIFWFEQSGNRISRKSTTLTKGGIAGYVFEHNVFVHVACACDHPAFYSLMDGLYKSRAALAIPLQAGNDVFSVIVCRAKKNLPCFSSADVHDLSFIAAGAAPALKSSMAYRKKMNELRVALRAQDRLAALLQTAESLSRETNIDTLVARILDNSCQLIGADRASLFVIDESRTHLISKVAHGTTKPLLLPINQGIAGSVATTGETVNIEDVYDDPRFNSNVDKSTGYRTKSLMTLPVHNQNGDIIAVMQLMNKLNGEPFSESDVELTRAMGVFTGIALANSTVIESSILSTQRVHALLDTAVLLMRGESLSSVIHHIMSVSRDLVQADRCALFLIDDKKSQIKSAVLAGEESQISVKRGKGVVGYVAMKNIVVNIDDAYKDKRFNSAVDQATGYRTRSILASPVVDSSSKVIGVVEMINKDMLYNGGSFTKEDEKLTTAFASFTGLAFDKTKNRNEAMTGQTLAIVLSNMMTADESNSWLPPSQIVMQPSQLQEYRSNRFDVNQLSELQSFRLVASFFFDLGLSSTFHINNAKLIRFLLCVHDLHMNSQYHSWRRSIESAQFIYFLLTSTEMAMMLSKLEILALLVAAICHDIDHYDIEDRGRSEIALSVLYRNRSVLEVHHCEQTISVITKPEQNIFEAIESEQQVTLWQTIISLILATDMSKHFDIFNKCKALVYPQNMLNLQSPQHRLFLMQIALKCADVSETCRLMPICERVAQNQLEMLRAESREKDKRTEYLEHYDIAKYQIGFFMMIARPLFIILCEAVPTAKPALDQLEGNLSSWKSKMK
ncbi:GAF domain containing protein [Tritrichomonas foetus]|uniref:GAF domain containing protein n=1 Tax=Tritrichomonas foetus TaxID=1144522 RepID=A0A1J4J5G7_9EUKA|nr:GAF domain containing protein [Tritrichomonas foetus]|eukprot:OHS94488.1 GAF domain containing protein [Tritrichomonas foetus]